MKGLRLTIPPFAPDDSGAAAVFCELGGLTVICDAGGCAGNVCGFDEPRWFGSRSAIFSAGLRDMDAILGRDDRLAAKVADAARAVGGNFCALIGTPVPAVIATDYRALTRRIGRETGLPALAVDTNGMEYYDVGASKANLALCRAFAGKKDTAEDFIGVFGATPLDTGLCRISPRHFSGETVREEAVRIYGMGAGFETLKEAHCARENLVIASAGLAAARWLFETYGTPWRCAYPLSAVPEIPGYSEWKAIREGMADFAGKRVLIVHQQILANALREAIRKRAAAEVTVATWFTMDADLMEEGDVRLKEEDDWIRLVREGGFDVILGDPVFRRALSGYAGAYFPLLHTAVSGKTGEEAEDE